MAELIVTGKVAGTNEPIRISFVEIPDDCEYVRFETETRQCELTVVALSENSSDALQSLAGTFGHHSKAELEVLLGDGYVMRVSSRGDYVRFTIDGEETAYWDHQEFEDPIVLGAVAGAIVCSDPV